MRRRAVSPARSRAVQTLRTVLERGTQARLLLAEAASGLSPADGDLVREIVLGVLRWRSALDEEIVSVCHVPFSRLAPGLREILEVALYQLRRLDRIPPYAAVDEAVRQARESGGEGAAKLVNAVLRNLLRLPPLPLGSALPLPLGGGGGLPAEASSFANASEDTLAKAGEGETIRAKAVLRESLRLPPLPPGEGRGEGVTTATSLALRFSHPEFLVARWLDRFGPETTLQILQADNAPSPLDLMANLRKISREKLADELREEGIETEPSELCPTALSVVSGKPIRSPLFAAGHFTIQDVGSQALPLLLPAAEMLVDLAAAPGGKSFAAVALGRAKRTIAVDRSLSRLRLVEENRRRLAMSKVRPVGGDVLTLPLPAGRFDRVLFDAPCSGTGTLRKNPEIRYRVTPEAIERLSKVQEEGLLSAAKLLAPGGYLLYSTCSLEEEENERVVQRVVAKTPELEPAEIQPPDGLAPFVSGNRFQLLPGPTSDGFTAHLVCRKA